MDTRLFELSGTRPRRLRQQDLPLVALGIISLMRGQAKVGTNASRGVKYVQIDAKNFTVQVLAEDWSKILPFIQDETFNQFVFKTELDIAWSDSSLAFDSSIIDLTDRQYFANVLGVLQTVFKEAYPTSNI